MKKKFAIVLALFLIAVVCSAGCIDPEDPVDPIDPVDPVDPVDPITPVDPVDPVVPTEEYSVMFMLNYGDAGAYTAETVKAGETVSKPATPTRSGYTFKGWFTAAEGGAAYDFTQPVNADVTLYAQWKKKSSSSSGGSSAPSTPTTPDTSCSHNWGVGDGWVEVNPATCTAPGLKERVCTLCSESETQEIPKLEHKMGAEVVLVPATCVEAGTNVSVCDYGCGETTTIPVAALGHKDADTNNVCDLCDVSLSKPEEGHTEHIFVLQSVEGNVGTLKCTGCDETSTEIYVAQVAGKYYTQFDWALENATESDVFVLLADANSEISKKVAINLNGKNATFTYDNINNVTILSPKGEGTLEVTADGKTVVFGEIVVADNLLPVAVAYTKTDTTYSEVDVYSAEGLVWTGNTNLNTGEGQQGTINIMNDLDMTGLDYNPIDNMFLTINGNSKTISNLNSVGNTHGQSGLLGYGGACTIKNLILENVKATGSQVGAFVGNAEGTKLDGCTLTGTVEIIWKQTEETWNGVGAVAGVSQGGATYANVCLDGATVTIKMNDMTTVALKVASFPIVGYIDDAGLKASTALENGAKITVIYADGFQSIHTVTETYYEISSAEGLGAFRDSVNAGETYKGQTVKLTADVDLKNEDWTPIGTETNKFEGTFDGQDKTISNLYINQPGAWNVGLFGFTIVGEIKNLILENAQIIGGGCVGTIAGTPYTSDYTNIKVTGHVTIDAQYYVGGVGGKNAYGDWTDITVNVDDTSYVYANSIEGTTAYRTYVGGVVGFMGEGGQTFTNVKSNIDVIGTTCDVGGIVGIAHYGNSFINCECTGDVTITNAAEAGEAEEMGGIAGVWMDSNSGDVTFTNCEFTGTLTANFMEGVDLSDNTITGKAYNGKGDGKLIIDGLIVVTSDASLDAVINDGSETIVLGSGNYIIPDSAQGKTLEFIGNGNTVVATQDDGSYEGCDYSLDGATVTFKNIKITTDSSTYTGYARLKATYENCVINGTYTLYDNSVFKNCTFNVAGDVYNIWTWGAPIATFENCTFNSDGKALLLYGTADTKLTLNNCTFNDNGGLTDKKAAVEIGNDYGKSYELIVNNCIVNGYEINDKGINTGTTLWGNKNSMGTDKLNVVVDGVDVY